MLFVEFSFYKNVEVKPYIARNPLTQEDLEFEASLFFYSDKTLLKMQKKILEGVYHSKSTIR